MAHSLKEAALVASESAPTMLTHLDTTIASQADPHELPRTIDDLRSGVGSASYDDSVQLATFARNRHNGQRKLCVALIEFLARVHHQQIATRGRTSPVLVLYVGASIVAALVAHELFPDDRFVCYDPNFEMTVDVARQELGEHANDIIDSKVKVARVSVLPGTLVSALKCKPVFLYTGSSTGRFRDSDCAYMTDVARDAGMELAFVSDIRRSIRGATKERGIAEDMVAQARWVLLLKVRLYSCKFRLPFKLTDEIRAEYAKLGQISDSAAENGLVPYLSGACSLQKHARAFSTELRLMGTEIPRMTRYSICEVESLLAPFNVVHRGYTHYRAYAAPSLTLTATGIPQAVVKYAADMIKESTGCMGTFDALGEACVLRDAVLTRDVPGSIPFLRACMRLCRTFAPRSARRWSV